MWMYHYSKFETWLFCLPFIETELKQKAGPHIVWSAFYGFLADFQVLSCLSLMNVDPSLNVLTDDLDLKLAHQDGLDTLLL